MVDAEEATSLKEVIQGMTGGEISLCQGIVQSASPLKIQVVNDEKIALTDANTIVPEHLKNYSVGVSISGGSASGSTTEGSITSITISNATMTVAAGLKAGDKVHLLSLNHGKQYFVLGRV